MKIITKRMDQPTGLAGYLWEASAVLDGEEYNEFGDTKTEAIAELKETLKIERQIKRLKKNT